MKNETLLNVKQAAEFLTVVPRTLQAWRDRGYGVQYIKVGRLIRYRQSDIETWLEAQVRQSTKDRT